MTDNRSEMPEMIDDHEHMACPQCDYVICLPPEFIRADKADAAKQITIKKLMEDAGNPPYGDARYESIALAQMIKKEYPNGIRIID